MTTRTSNRELRAWHEAVETMAAPSRAVETMAAPRKAGMWDVVRAVRALASSNGGAGGYLVGSDLAREVLALPVPGIARRYARTVEMTTKSMAYAALNNDVHYTGGAALSWGNAEGAAIADTEPRFGGLTFDSHKLSGLVKISNELFEDGATPDTETALREVFARAVWWHLDRALLLGTGGGEPLGLLNAPCAVTQTRATGGQAAYADLAAMFGLLHPACYGPGTVVLASLSALAGLFGASQSVWALLEAVSSATGGARVPIVPVEWLPPMGTRGDVIVTDLSHYVLATRDLAIEAAPDDPSGFLRDQTVMRVGWRGDGMPWLSSSVLLAGDPSGARRSSIVILE